MTTRKRSPVISAKGARPFVPKAEIPTKTPKMMQEKVIKSKFDMYAKGDLSKPNVAKEPKKILIGTMKKKPWQPSGPTSNGRGVGM